MLAALAAFSPWELGKKADPFAPVPPWHPPGMVFPRSVSDVEAVAGHIASIEGELIGVIGMGVAAGALVVLPFLDRRSSRGEPSVMVTVIGVCALVYLAVLTVVGYVLA